MKDAELLLRIRQRDRGALEELYDRHASRLFAISVRILGNNEEAAETLEDLFVAVADGSEPYAGGTLGAWLVRATRDRALARRAALGEAQNLPPSVDPSMAPTPRQLVEQAFFGGMDVADLARLHGLGESTVRNLLVSGMAELRNQFGVTK